MTNPSILETTFFAALAKSSDAERSLFLDEACSGNPELRRQVEKMLAAHREAGEFMQQPGVTVDDELRGSPTISEAVGSSIGPYKLLQQIGEGGMGVVFMAEQVSPIRRLVALKIIKQGMDTRQVIARFEAERQALAMMDHPNVAKVLEAGTTASGRPYFVMELVKGVPITTYCDDRKLSVRARLDLFIPVCIAVQHAHQKGLIHRDIKPTNVLVAEYDNHAVPKVIDFGVAKAIAQAMTERTLFTEYGQVVGTVEYMSPEQAKLNQLDIDTRSDIYSLGVLLYELLTGTTPFGQKRLKEAAFDEMLRIIREEEPQKPSTRLSTVDTLPSIAANRGMESLKLNRQVRGELDWIAMKCLEKDRGRRYDSAAFLAADVMRYLADEPISAGAPSARYRLQKFVLRHRGKVATAVLSVLLLVGGIAGTTWGLIGERKARQQAVWAAESAKQAKEAAEAREAEVRAVLDFVQTRILSAARPQGQDGGLGRNVELRTAVEAAVPFVESSFQNQPLVGARLRQTLGVSFWYLGDPKTAAAQFEAARTLFTTHRGPDHPDTLSSMHSLANAYTDLGRDAEALSLREQTLALQRVKLGPDHPATLRSMNNLAHSYEAFGRYAEALTLREETLALMRTKLGVDDSATLANMTGLANDYDEVGRDADALRLREQTLALQRGKLGPNHAATLWSMNNLAISYANAGRDAEALTLREETLARRKVQLGGDHPDTLDSMHNLSFSYADSSRDTDAMKLREETLALRMPKLGPDHPDTLRSMKALAQSYFNLGRDADALQLRNEVLSRRKATLGPDHFDTLKSMEDVVQSLLRLGRQAAAIALIDDILRRAADTVDVPDFVPRLTELRKTALSITSPATTSPGAR